MVCLDGFDQFISGPLVFFGLSLVKVPFLRARESQEFSDMGPCEARFRDTLGIGIKELNTTDKGRTINIKFLRHGFHDGFSILYCLF